MNFGCKIICTVMILLQFFYSKEIFAATCLAITVMNHNINKSTIVLEYNVVPVYRIFSLHNPERIVIDILKNCNIRKNILPMHFYGNSLIKCVRLSTPVKLHSVRVVVDLTYCSNIEVIIQKKMKDKYHLVLTVLKKRTFFMSNSCGNTKRSSVVPVKTQCTSNIQHHENNKKNVMTNNIQCNANNLIKDKMQSSCVLVAIDAGHGGQDPGATGYNKMTYEKNITINIARKLKRFLDADPMFSAVMIRDGDYFLSVTERSDIAREKGANILVSIHTDSALNVNIRGASVWVLSDRRAKSEMVYLLQRCEKYSALLGGLGDILKNYRHHDPYFNYFFLDLQFGYSQKVGYTIAKHVLCQLKNISILHKNLPEYSSFGVLRSPDIPSVLVETGFISNKQEGYLLSSNRYQEKIANAIYKGLRSYFITICPKKTVT